MASIFGKLIKNSDKEKLKILDIDNYPWVDFNENTIIFPDNPRKSVIQEKMHTEQELQRKIKEAKNFKNQLGPRTRTIKPLDLTKDYDKGQLEALKRRRRDLMDEEEVMAMELAELENDKRIRDIALNLSNAQKKSKEKSKAEKKKEKKLIEKKRRIKRRKKIEIKNEKKQEIKFEKETEKIADKEEKKPEIKEQKSYELSNEEKEKIYKEAFQQAYEKAFNEGKAEGQSKGFEEGKKEGYEIGFEESSAAGFQFGEEKGLKSIESKFERTFQNISESASNLEGLKYNILTEGRELFLEFLKLSSEKILQEKLKINEKILFNLFDSVIKNYKDANALKIKMNSSDIKKLEKHIENRENKNKITLEKDENLEDGSFQVESESKVTLVDLKKSIEQILNQIKPELFKLDENEEESSLLQEKFQKVS